MAPADPPRPPGDDPSPDALSPYRAPPPLMPPQRSAGLAFAHAGAGFVWFFLGAAGVSYLDDLLQGRAIPGDWMYPVAALWLVGVFVATYVLHRRLRRARPEWTEARRTASALYLGVALATFVLGFVSMVLALLFLGLLWGACACGRR